MQKINRVTNSQSAQPQNEQSTTCSNQRESESVNYKVVMCLVTGRIPSCSDLSREVGDVSHILQVALLVLPQEVAGVAQFLLGGVQQRRIRFQLRHSRLQVTPHLK